MVITIIRHAKVQFQWNSIYNSNEYRDACISYETSPIIHTITKERPKLSNDQSIFTSRMQRTYDTANLLFDNPQFKMTPLLNEVPLSPFIDTKLKLPLFLWNICGRLQWYINRKTQSETRRQTYLRARHIVKLIKKEDQDCILITHAFFMLTLIKVLKRNGFQIHKRNLRINNLGIITVVSK